MKNVAIVFLTTSVLACTGAFASLQINALSTPSVITFDQRVGWDGNPDNNPVNNVYKSGFDGSQRILERNSAGWYSPDNATYAAGFSAEAWAWRHSGVNLSGGGNNVRTSFGDFNNNSDFTNASGSITGFLIGQYYGSAGNRSFVLGNGAASSADWANLEAVLRIQNNTGETLNNWNIKLDLWLNEVDSNTSDFVLSYSTNDTDYTTVQTFVGASTGGVWTQSLDSADGGFNIAATVANGGYFYLSLHNNRLASSGSAWSIDNISVTAVPEPSTYALMLSVFLIGFVAVRRIRTTAGK